MLAWIAITDKLWQAWAYLTTGRVLATVVGVGFAVLAIVLFAASRTRWGHSKPLTKCIVLSVLAHVWLLMYALGYRQVLPQGDPLGRQSGLAVSFEPLDDPISLSSSDAIEPTAKEWENFTPMENLPLPTELLQDNPLQWEESPDLLGEVEVTPLPALPTPVDLQDPSQIEVPQPELASEPLESPPELPMTAEQTEEPLDSLGSLASIKSPTAVPVLPQPIARASVAPEEYQLRQDKNRMEIIRAFGADEDSEAAVQAALQWLSKAQSPDGSWNSARYGGGTETRALGEYRYGTGDRADTGITGLALLAFLSAGHTHEEGEFQNVVGQGLGYLLREQMPSGDLSGHKQIGNEHSVVNARMYCHSIALLALAEAHAMTRDPILREALLTSAQYTINAQDPRGGGWRYRPGESGDLSLFGWKAMALRSVQRSGIEVPSIVNQRMLRFIDSCSTGKGGLARYRPGEGAPSPTMTAEALACRLLLRFPLTLEARQEACELILRNLPGTQPDNVYYWYYATLALFQLQDHNWRTWNQALKARLLETQQPAYGDEPGSWDPDRMWGGYGGRVYSTAMSCLCLEVYYRYLPMYR
jgi:hypothetical protein